MTRRLALVALWFAGTAVAIVMVSFAVRLVGDSVVAEGPATVTRGEVEADLSATPATGTVATPPPSAPTLPAEQDPTAPSTTSTPPSVSPTPTSAPATTSVIGPTPTAPPAGGDPVPVTTAAPPLPPAPSPTTVAPVEQSFPLVGGSVRVRCTGDAASLVSSSPNPGYTMEVRSTGPERVEVRFTASEHTSELRTWCTGGAIDAEPKESGQGDGGRG